MNIGKRALESTIFVAATTYAAEVVNFVTSIILARLLLPEHFGIIALGMFFLELFGRVREFGFDQALIHRQKDLDKAYSSHFLLHFLAAALSALLALIASPILLRFYSAEIVKVLLIFSFFFLFKAVSFTQRIALEKNLRFAETSLVDFCSLLLASVLAVILAAKGFGLWSLVIYHASTMVFVFFGLWLLRPWKFQLLLDRQMFFWFLKFGIFLWLGGLTTFILFKYNDFVAGTFLGTTALGFYSRAANFAQRPTSSITSVVSRVTFPTYALLQKDREKLTLTFNLVLRHIVRISAPLSLLLFLLARDFTLALLGERWLPMVPIFKLLLIYGFLRSIFDDVGALLTAIGKPKLTSIYLGIQAGLLLFTAPIFTLALGAAGTALSLDLVMLLGVFLAYRCVSRFVKLDLFGIFLPSLVPVLLTSIVFGFARPGLAGNSPLLTFLARGTFATFTYIFFALVFGWSGIKKDLCLLWGFARKK